MKYIFFDIDGTLKGKSRVITPNTIKAIKQLQENGHRAFLCTGRAPISITPDLYEMGFDGIIASAGSFIQYKGEYIFESFMDPKLLQQAIVLFLNAKVGFTLETKDCLFQSVEAMEFIARRRGNDIKKNPELARMFEQNDRSVNIKPLSEFDPAIHKVTKIVFISYDKYALLDTVPHLAKSFHIVQFSKPEDEFINGEIIVKDCTKATAIEYIINYFNANMEDTIAYGDSMNDYQMIEKAHMGIVYEGAKEKLLDIASDTFIDPDLDGIPLSLKKLGLI